MARGDRVVLRERGIDEVMSARASIRNHCLACMGWEDAAKEVDKCTSPHCWLYPWRLGTTPPAKKRVMSAKRKKQLQKQLAGARKWLTGP